MAKPTNIVQAYINHQTGDLYADIGKLNLSLTASGVTVTGSNRFCRGYRRRCWRSWISTSSRIWYSGRLAFGRSYFP